MKSTWQDLYECRLWYSDCVWLYSRESKRLVSNFVAIFFVTKMPLLLFCPREELLDQGCLGQESWCWLRSFICTLWLRSANPSQFVGQRLCTLKFVHEFSYWIQPSGYYDGDRINLTLLWPDNMLWHLSLLQPSLLFSPSSKCLCSTFERSSRSTACQVALMTRLGG